MTKELPRESQIVVEGDSLGPLPEIDGYDVLKRIGRGGMGEVFVARQVRLKRLVAIKFLLEEAGQDSFDDLARFHREAELMAKVSHPNVLSIHDFGEVDGRPYLVMEYIEGGDLRRQMTPNKPLSEQKVRSVVMPVGEALDYLHRHEIIHRDLKPENILLHDGSNPRVSDFGIAVLRAGAGTLTRSTRGVGTLGYVAPEQQYRLKVDERADQYSLAAVAYEMLTGQLPLGVFKPPSELNPSLSPAVDPVIMRALQENPKSRYPTIRDFTKALDTCLAREPSKAHRRIILIGSLLLLSGIVWLSLSGWKPFAPALKSPPPISQAETKVQSPGSSSPLIEELTKIWAHREWVKRGKPEGEPREQTDEYWFSAKRQIEAQLCEIAYDLWVKQGRPRGEAGNSVALQNWIDAQKILEKRLKTNQGDKVSAPDAAEKTGH